MANYTTSNIKKIEKVLLSSLEKDELDIRIDLNSHKSMFTSTFEFIKDSIKNNELWSSTDSSQYALNNDTVWKLVRFKDDDDAIPFVYHSHSLGSLLSFLPEYNTNHQLLDCLNQMGEQLSTLLKGEYSHLSIWIERANESYEKDDVKKNNDWVGDTNEQVNDIFIRLVWYPETSVGFRCIAANTLSDCLKALDFSPKTENKNKFGM